MRQCPVAFTEWAPNKRLKLTGGDRFKGSGVLCPWGGTDCRPTPLRRRGGGPQLNGDRLGRARSWGADFQPQVAPLQDWESCCGERGSGAVCLLTSYLT